MTNCKAFSYNYGHKFTGKQTADRKNSYSHSEAIQGSFIRTECESSIVSAVFIMRRKWDFQTVANVINLENTTILSKGTGEL